MSTQRIRFLFLNIGHFLDHLFVLIFATAAALTLVTEWDMSYGELIPYATPGFVAFGVCAIPAGWLADKWSREGMIVVFFVGIGATSILAGFADSPLELAAYLTLVGAMAAIYHPVGLALVVQGRERTGVPLAINGIFGNMGVASAALITGFLIDTAGWRQAFIYPGILSILVGIGFLGFLRQHRQVAEPAGTGPGQTAAAGHSRNVLVRAFAIVLVTTGIGGVVFQSTTFALPKVFEERLGDLAQSATAIGGYAFLVFTVAAFAQLIVGWLVDRFPIRRIFALLALIQAVFLLAMTQLSGMAALLISLAFMLAVFGQIPINDVLVGRISKSEWRARAYALRYIVTFSVMASTVPLIGWVHGRWGFDVLFPMLSVAAVMIFAAVLLLPAGIVAVAAVAPGAAAREAGPARR
ncbi:MAG: MFS transporter [Gammaproteobacteria bacterium]|nr:MFS transporter [Gammaproteobacteria bacterium]MXY63730.1 MFS transporter [Gammaproteobacteria bacterium]MYG67291.1 MFS transporter [Gammaproteobacteria bacterium]